MNTPPDFSALAALLLAPYRSIDLIPKELGNNGNVVILVPARDGKPLDCTLIKPESIPRIDLRMAGVETDRRPQTILNEVGDLLCGRKFTIEPTFDFVRALSAYQDIALALDLHKMSIELEVNHWLASRPTRITPEQRLNNFIEELSRFGFFIHLEGDPISGLDLSEATRGFILSVLNFLIPDQNRIHENDAHVSALIAVRDFCHITNEVNRAEQDYRKYLAEQSGKWYFPLFNSKKEKERQIRAHKDNLQANLAIVRAAFATLQLPFNYES